MVDPKILEDFVVRLGWTSKMFLRFREQCLKRTGINVTVLMNLPHNCLVMMTNSSLELMSLASTVSVHRSLVEWVRPTVLNYCLVGRRAFQVRSCPSAPFRGRVGVGSFEDSCHPFLVDLFRDGTKVLVDVSVEACGFVIYK